MLEQLKLDELLQASLDTIYMSFVSTILVAIFGLILGIILFVSDEYGIAPNKYLYKFVSSFVNIFRSVPFMILIILLIPFTYLIVGSITGVNAFLPGLVIGASPFYARIVQSAFKEVDKGVIEAASAIGASNSEIVIKVLIRESLPSLINGLTITCISIIGYTAMAGMIGGGGLGELARRYGVVKNNYVLTLGATICALIIVLVVQYTGDKISRKIDKR